MISSYVEVMLFIWLLLSALKVLLEVFCLIGGMTSAQEEDTTSDEVNSLPTMFTPPIKSRQSDYVASQDKFQAIISRRQQLRKTAPSPSKDK